MSYEGSGADAVGIFLTGGGSNTDPDASLGGAPSTALVRGLGAIVGISRIPAIQVLNVYPACGEGTAYLTVNADGDVYFTPPGGGAGTAVSIAAGETKVVAGSTTSKAVRIYRESGLPMPIGSLMEMTLRDLMNGVLGMGNLTSAQRAAGRTTYRAVVLKARRFSVLNVRLWLPAVNGAQSTYSLATEDLSGGSIQTVASETTAPSGLSWSSPTSEGTALTIPKITTAGIGLWIRRVFPAAGTVSARENVQLAMKFRAA